MKRGHLTVDSHCFRKGNEWRRRAGLGKAKEKERECDKMGPKYDLRGLYTETHGCLNERGNWLSEALPLSLFGLLGMLSACGRFLYDILTFEEHGLPATSCRAMSVRRRRRKAQRGLTLQMRPELVFPAEVVLAMGAFDPRTTVLGEAIVAL